MAAAASGRQHHQHTSLCSIQQSIHSSSSSSLSSARRLAGSSSSSYNHAPQISSRIAALPLVSASAVSAASAASNSSRNSTGNVYTRASASASASASDIALETVDTKFNDFTATTAFLFPGQGAQYVGMAQETAANVPAAAAMFAKASDILGYDLLAVCADGPKDKLDSTAISQPAIYVSSLAAIEALKLQDGGQAVIDSCDVAAGLSLGEYTALAFAGAISFEDGLNIVRIRGESMQAASDATPSAMASVIGLNADKAEELCALVNEKVGEADGIKVANYLCKGNYAISGGVKGIEELEATAKSFGAKMVVRLAVAGAFHTHYMAPAVPKLESILAETTIHVPRVPVISNVDAMPHSDPDTIRAILGKQVTSSVQWEPSIELLLKRGVTQSYELGPGKVIAGIMKRIDRKAQLTNVSV